MKRTPCATSTLRRLALVALPAAVLLGACGSSSNNSATDTTLALTPRVTVTSVKGNVESQLLAAVYARALEDAGFRVARKDPIALDRAGYVAAMEKNDFQLIPDYTGDLLKFVYDQPGAGAAPTTIAPGAPATTGAPVTIPAATTTLAPGTTAAGATTVAPTTAAPTTAAPTTAAGATTTLAPAQNTGRAPTEQIVAIKAQLAKALTVGNAAGAENRNVIACTPAAITTNAKVQFSTYTNLASVAPRIVLGAPASFMTDTQEGLASWTNTYGGTFKSTVTVEAAGLGAAIDKGTADCFVMNSLDPLLTTKKMTLLTDDKVMTRGNAVVALLASAIATPDLITALDTVNAALTTTRLNQMLNEINANGTDPTVVANAFMDTI
jgi:glycine betaine/choline ABC-type transport system substrate-binding protein